MVCCTKRYEQFAHRSFCRANSNNHFEKFILKNLNSTYANLLQHFICTNFPMIEDYEKYALRKEPIIAPFVE